VASLENKAKELKRLMPEAQIAIGHGQMHPNDLKDVMFKFHHHEIDILICTTIIESGLDIPNANTLLVEDAQNFGLSQLHQIRGRVGRSKRQAYAYFLTSNEKQLTKNAAARIEALKYGDSLNSGFNLAMRDLEIRGAGEILGEKQSGAIDFVGLTLFTSMIERSIKMLKGSIDSEINEIEIRIGTNGYITEKYIPQPEVRLSLYKKISSIKKLEDLDEINKELEDRFGSLPKETNNLLTLTQIRILSSKLSINKISSNKDKISLFLDENNLLTPPNSKIEKIMINLPESLIDKVDFLLNKLKSFYEQLQKAS
jgi:transcription-repair coupling factor (superfamily II helicase)